MMELCPICRRMTAERSHYTGIMICYNRFCIEDSIKATEEEWKEKTKPTAHEKPKPKRRIEICEDDNEKI